MPEKGETSCLLSGPGCVKFATCPSAPKAKGMAAGRLPPFSSPFIASPFCFLGRRGISSLFASTLCCLSDTLSVETLSGLVSFPARGVAGSTTGVCSAPGVCSGPSPARSYTAVGLEAAGEAPTNEFCLVAVPASEFCLVAAPASSCSDTGGRGDDIIHFLSIKK